ncbi:MAG: hypothetical protein IIA14_13140 [SAR324 cluster bacterium]|nr:hypothetical protein [SAR324 cluster bacterium]
MKRTLITGIRQAGDPRFVFTICGNPASKFPPVVLHTSLGELRKWLEHAAPLSPRTHLAPDGAVLRLVT